MGAKCSYQDSKRRPLYSDKIQVGLECSSWLESNSSFSK